MRPHLEVVVSHDTLIQRFNQQKRRFADVDDHVYWTLQHLKPLRPSHPVIAEAIDPEGITCTILLATFVQYGRPYQVVSAWRGPDTDVLMEVLEPHQMKMPDPPPRHERDALEQWLRMHED